MFKNDWKHVEQSAAPKQAQRFLFRIPEDPAEERDVAGKYPALMEELLAILRNQPVGSPDSLR